jgi:hypothetical protein
VRRLKLCKQSLSSFLFSPLTLSCESIRTPIKFCPTLALFSARLQRFKLSKHGKEASTLVDSVGFPWQMFLDDFFASDSSNGNRDASPGKAFENGKQRCFVRM